MVNNKKISSRGSSMRRRMRKMRQRKSDQSRVWDEQLANSRRSIDDILDEYEDMIDQHSLSWLLSTYDPTRGITYEQFAAHCMGLYGKRTEIYVKS
jgi:hypothetical protein